MKFVLSPPPYVGLHPQTARELFVYTPPPPFVSSTPCTFRLNAAEYGPPVLYNTIILNPNGMTASAPVDF